MSVDTPPPSPDTPRRPAESEETVKAALAKIRTDLEALRAQVEKKGKAETERKTASVSIQALNKMALNPEARTKLVGSLEAALKAAATPDQIRTVIEMLDKNGETLTKSLRDLARDVSRDTPYISPDTTARWSGSISRGVDGFIDNFFNQRGTVGEGGERRFMGMNAEEAKMLIKDLLASFFASAGADKPGPFSKAFNTMGKNLYYEIAVRRHGSPPAPAPDETIQKRWSACYDGWHRNMVYARRTPGAPPEGDPPTIAEASVVPMPERFLSAEERKKAVGETVGKEGAKKRIETLDKLMTEALDLRNGAIQKNLVERFTLLDAAKQNQVLTALDSIPPGGSGRASLGWFIYHNYASDWLTSPNPPWWTNGSSPLLAFCKLEPATITAALDAIRDADNDKLKREAVEKVINATALTNTEKAGAVQACLNTQYGAPPSVKNDIRDNAAAIKQFLTAFAS